MTRSKVARTRVVGLSYLLVVAGFIWLTVSIYQGRFTEFVGVRLLIDRVGNQLEKNSDVKYKGVFVGTVKQISTRGDGAVVDLGLVPGLAAEIPQGVSARLLPKTLFGERYVNLVDPPTAGGRGIADGTTIPQDHSSQAVELNEILDNLMPVLTAIKPEKLSMALTSIAQALTTAGGENIGTTIVSLDTYLDGIEPSIPALKNDLQMLPKLLQTYQKAAPDLVDALDTLTTTTGTLAGYREHLAAIFGTVRTGAADLSSFLEVNKSNLISLSASLAGNLGILARYSPEFPCLFRQLSSLAPRIDRAFGKGQADPHQLHVSISVGTTRGKYVPGRDEPRFDDDRGPRCYPYVSPGRTSQYPADGPLRDGSKQPPAPADPSQGLGSLLDGALPIPVGGGSSPGSTTASVPNSPADRALIRGLAGASGGMAPESVPDWSSYLVGPVYRGAEVSAS
ncbi:MCE family protein [Amycolatopsis sp. NPDC049691]|uniref:MCE family protein n=1 Tax=Amycolatopsis sp. NPDC049691 TaxID=3155155 RepID=UPI003437B29E